MPLLWRQDVFDFCSFDVGWCSLIQNELILLWLGRCELMGTRLQYDYGWWNKSSNSLKTPKICLQTSHILQIYARSPQALGRQQVKEWKEVAQSDVKTRRLSVSRDQQPYICTDYHLDWKFYVQLRIRNWNLAPVLIKKKDVWRRKKDPL